METPENSEYHTRLVVKQRSYVITRNATVTSDLTLNLIFKATQQTPAYLTFARELRSPIAVQSDLRAVIECIEHQQDLRKTAKDKSRRTDELAIGDFVLMNSYVLSSASKGVSSKFMPKRDGPYRIQKRVSPTTYLLTFPGSPDKVIGKYHISDLRRYYSREGECPEVPQPVALKSPRGRPRKGTVL
ncbi:unnamed protein product [Euphydryas editha]|uniref:Tf2-1-like SH3-like domain-containing protein n=1 Tax=Euphydryas editha TaxID=104508 RepID=A0AAU9UXC2_EUPED|nr:unnamed protein product [Euphydryas editha]